MTPQIYYALKIVFTLASARVVNAAGFTPSNAGTGWFKMADLCPYNVS